MPGEVDITSTPLSGIQWSGNLQQLVDLVASHLTGTLVGGVLTGQVGGTAPTSDIGIWLNQRAWYAWHADTGRYLPIPLSIGRVAGDGSLTVTSIYSSATANRNLTAPDRDGTLALLSDLSKGEATQQIIGTTITVDWESPTRAYYLSLTGNTTINMVNTQDGKDKEFLVENPSGASFTVTFTNVRWPAGVQPTQTPQSGPNRVIDLWRIKHRGYELFGDVKQNYSVPGTPTAPPPGSDTTPPAIFQVDRDNSGNVYIRFNELLQTMSLSTSQFTVKKNGTTVGLTSARADGDTVKVDTSTTFTSSNSVTVKYVGTSIVDMSGNAAVNFGPLSASYVPPDAGGGGGISGWDGQHTPP